MPVIKQTLQPLIDTEKGFLPIYSLYQHEQLGYLLAAFVVEKTHAGNLSLKYQRLLPENYNNFKEGLEESDKVLTNILYDISLNNLFRQFGTKEGSIQTFFAKFTQSAYKDYIGSYIQKRLVEALPQMQDKHFYLMSKDGYPAWKKIYFSTAPAKILFNIHKSDKEIDYSCQITHDNNIIALDTGNSGIITFLPTYVLFNQTVFTFDQEVEGKKLLPFVKKPKIVISKERENEFYATFLTKLIEHYPVEAKGITIVTETPPPQFKLKVTKDATNSFTFRPIAQYGLHQVVLGREDGKFISECIENDGKFIFYRINRMIEMEKEMLSLYLALKNEKSPFIEFILPEQKAYHWLDEHYLKLITAGIEIWQDYQEKINLNKPRLDAHIVETDNSFEINAQFLVGASSYNLQLIKEAVFNENQKVQLPDGLSVLIPKNWIEDFRLFFEVAVQDGDKYILKKYEAALFRQLFTKQADKNSQFADFENIEKKAPPAYLKAELREYQQAGYEWLCFLQRYQMGGILADDMGLGKTVQALSILQHEMEANVLSPSLIVVPNTLIFNWLAEMQKFTPKLKSIVYTGAKRGQLKGLFHHYQVVITTYGTVRQDYEKLAAIPFHYIILDECQAIKNSDSKITHAVFRLNAKHRLCITGTPIENSAMDLWTMMHFLNPGMLGSATFFEDYFVNQIEKHRNESRSLELRRLVFPFILRRTKEMVATELPEKIIDSVFCEMTEEQKKLYELNKMHYKSTLFIETETQTEEKEPKNKIQILAGLQRMRQIAIHPQLIGPNEIGSGKYQVAMEMLADILAQGSKVIIFSQFVKMLSIFKQDLTKMGITFSYLDGSTKNREKEVNNFQDNDKVKVFLTSLKAGGVGINLTAAQYILIIDPWWNPATEMQAINRAHRIGQKNTIFIYKFITKGTIEEKIVAMQNNKSELANEIIRTEAGFFKSLKKEDLLNLFD